MKNQEAEKSEFLGGDKKELSRFMLGSQLESKVFKISPVYIVANFGADHIFPENLRNKPIKEKCIEIIKRYTGHEYYKLNNFLRDPLGNPSNELKSFADWVFIAIRTFRDPNLKGLKVFRGLSSPLTKEWKIGESYYFAECLSTSKSEIEAKKYDYGGGMIVIDIPDNVSEEDMYYCNISDYSFYPEEQEILFCPYSKFRLDKIEGDRFYLTYIMKAEGRYGYIDIKDKDLVDTINMVRIIFNFDLPSYNERYGTHL